MYDINFGWAGGSCAERLISDGIVNISVVALIVDDGDVGHDSDRSVNDEGDGCENSGGDGIVDDDGDGIVDDDDGDGIVEDDGGGDSSGLSVEQQLISSDSVICEDISIVEAAVEEEVEELTFFFLKDERKKEWIRPRFGSLSPGCILKIIV